MPDPRHGVFETLLVLSGRPVELDAHLARLHASLAELFPHHDPPPLDVPLERGPCGPRSNGTSADAMRITVAPARDGALAAQVEWREVPPGAVLPDSGSSPGGGTSLVSIAVPGGLGAHKWVDRRLLDEAQASLPDRALPLITDEDGNVLEASRANLFVVRDGALSTPPLDGRILPGITRVRVSEIAAEMGIERREARLTRDDLLTADEVFLTGSVRGIERARQLDGALLGTDGGIAARLAAELRAAQRGGSLTSSSVTR